MIIGEFHHNELQNDDDIVVEAVELKKLFSKFKTKAEDLLSKIKKPKDSHSSGASEKSLDEMTKEFSFYNENDYIIDEFSFGSKPEVTYKKLETILNYFYNSADAQFKYQFEVAELALEYGYKCLNAKKEEDVKDYYNQVVKEVNTKLAKLYPSIDKTAQYSLDITKLCKRKCKYVKEQLSEEELKKLHNLCSTIETKMNSILKKYSDKSVIFNARYNKLLSQFNKLVDDKSYEKRCVACATIAGQIIDNYINKEYGYTVRDCKFTINDVNYIYKYTDGRSIKELFDMSGDEYFIDESFKDLSEFLKSTSNKIKLKIKNFFSDHCKAKTKVNESEILDELNFNFGKKQPPENALTVAKLDEIIDYFLRASQVCLERCEDVYKTSFKYMNQMLSVTDKNELDKLFEKSENDFDIIQQNATNKTKSIPNYRQGLMSEYCALLNPYTSSKCNLLKKYYGKEDLAKFKSAASSGYNKLDKLLSTACDYANKYNNEGYNIGSKISKLDKESYQAYCIRGVLNYYFDQSYTEAKYVAQDLAHISNIIKDFIDYL